MRKHVQKIRKKCSENAQESNNKCRIENAQKYANKIVNMRRPYAKMRNNTEKFTQINKNVQTMRKQITINILKYAKNAQNIYNNAHKMRKSCAQCGNIREKCAENVQQ